MIELKAFRRKRPWFNFKEFAGIHLEGLRKPRKSSIRIAGLRVEI
jgi:hypothetical protein